MARPTSPETLEYRFPQGVPGAPGGKIHHPTFEIEYGQADPEAYQGTTNRPKKAKGVESRGVMG